MDVRHTKRLFWLFALFAVSALLSVGMRFLPESSYQTDRVKMPGQRSVYHIGLLLSDDIPEQNRMADGILAGLSAKGYMDGRNLQIERLNGSGDSAILKQGTADFVKKGKDLIITVGTEAAKASAQGTEEIPIISAGVLDFRDDPFLSERPNVTGMSDIPDMVRQLETARKMIPFEKLGIIFNPSEEGSKERLQMLRRAAARRGIHLYETTASTPAQAVQRAADMAHHVQAVYFPEDKTLLKAFPDVLRIFDAMRIPVIGEEENMVRRGALLSVSEDYYRMGFSAAAMAAQILRGEAAPFQIPVLRESDSDMVINMAKARFLNIRVPNGLWQQARKLYLYEGQAARP